MWVVVFFDALFTDAYQTTISGPFPTKKDALEYNEGEGIVVQLQEPTRNNKPLFISTTSKAPS